jgi:hypothetical protein
MDVKVGVYPKGKNMLQCLKTNYKENIWDTEAGSNRMMEKIV